MRRTLLSTILAHLTVTAASHAAIVYVNAGQNLPLASQDGTSWGTAYQQLYDALSEEPGNNEFWIATGVYKPTPTNDRTQRFLLNQNQTLYGGFLPGATSPSERDPTAHPTILSGDIGVPGVDTDNSFRIVQIQNNGATLDGLIIEDAYSYSDGTAGAGGVNVAGAPFTLERCVVRRCKVLGRGGALRTVASNGTIRHCSFENNVAENAGGALDIQGTTLRLANTRFVGNRGESGGAIFVLSVIGGSIQNCVFSGNTAAAGFGGAIDHSNTPLTVSACTFSNNSASIAGGAVRFNFFNAGNSLSNCLFSNNTAPNLPQISALAGSQILHNGFSSAPFAGTGNVIVTAAFVDADGADDIVGTSDDDLRLSAGSGAIDHGCGTLLPADITDLDDDGNVSEPIPLDIEGDQRLVDEQAANSGVGALPYLDFGAHEFHRDYIILYVNGSVRRGMGDGSSWQNAFKDLQEAITLAMTGGFPKPVEIWVAQGTYVPTSGTDRTISFSPSGNLKIYGGFEGVEASRAERLPFKYPTILSGEIGSGSPGDNSFHVVRFSGDNVYADTLLDGFVITGGNATGSGLNDRGAGMLIENVARPTIRNCRFLDNLADAGGGGACATGGGTGGSLFNCYLAENVAGRGGAVFATEGANQVEIINCTIASNHADAAGGLFAGDGGTRVTVLNALFTLNTHGEADDATAHLLAVGGATLTISHSAVPCGSGLGAEMVSLPPKLLDLAGDDHLVGTLDDSLALAAGSPCIDAGSLSLALAGVPQDTFDADDDGDLVELAPFDIDGSERSVDLPNIPNADPACAIDIGADEAGFSGAGPGEPADFNGDGQVNGADLAILLGGWGGGGPNLDLTGDCTVNGADLAVLLGSWTS